MRWPFLFAILIACAVGLFSQHARSQTSSPYHTNPLPQVPPQASLEPEPKSPVPSKSSRYEKELMAADVEFCKQTAARRIDGWMDAFAPDAAVMHDGQTVNGTQAIRAYYEPVFANANFTLTWTPTHAEASKDGTSGYTYGTYQARSGNQVTHGMYLTIWRRDKSTGGKWKVALDTGSAASQ